MFRKYRKDFATRNQDLSPSYSATCLPKQNIFNFARHGPFLVNTFPCSNKINNIIGYNLQMLKFCSNVGM